MRVLVLLVTASLALAGCISAQERLELANRFLSAGELDKAIEVLTAAIDSRPDYAEAYLARAGALHKKGDDAGATRDATRALELQGDLPEASR